MPTYWCCTCEELRGGYHKTLVCCTSCDRALVIVDEADMQDDDSEEDDRQDDVDDEENYDDRDENHDDRQENYDGHRDDEEAVDRGEASSIDKENEVQFTVIATTAVDVECSVCLDELQAGTKVPRLPCQHLFHLQCLVQWLTKQSHCPICQVELPRLI